MEDEQQPCYSKSSQPLPPNSPQFYIERDSDESDESDDTECKFCKRRWSRIAGRINSIWRVCDLCEKYVCPRCVLRNCDIEDDFYCKDCFCHVYQWKAFFCWLTITFFMFSDSRWILLSWFYPSHRAKILRTRWNKKWPILPRIFWKKNVFTYLKVSPLPLTNIDGIGMGILGCPRQ